MRSLLFVLMVVILAACQATPAPTTRPSEEIVLMPFASATSTVIPSLTPTEVPPTTTAIPTADPRFFRDDFTESLDPQWSWVREDPQNWSLTTVPGSLQINVTSGYVTSRNNSNLLLRPAPQGNFQIETQITFRPTHTFLFAGLIIYQDDKNFIQAGRGFCNSTGCAGEGLYMHYYKNGVLMKPDFGQPYKDLDPILLRLSRQDDIYTFEASTDGKVWFLIGSHQSDLTPAQMGLVTGQRMRGEILPALFDFFEVRSLP